MIGLLLAAVFSTQSELQLHARSHQEGGAFELSVSGKARGAPEGSVVTVRFRKIVSRAGWSSPAIETRPVEPTWTRIIPLECGAFHLRERLDPPGDVEVEIVVAPPGERDGSMHRQIVHGATVAEKIRMIRADATKIQGLLEDASAGRRPVRKAPLGALPATAELLDLFFSDGERLALSTSKSIPLSAISGEPLTASGQREILAWIGDVFSRERQTAIVGELRRVAQEIMTLAGSGDSRAWRRSLPSLEKSLQALEEAVHQERSEDLSALMADTEMLFNLAPMLAEAGPMGCPGWAKVVQQAVQGGQDAEERLRTLTPRH